MKKMYIYSWAIWLDGQKDDEDCTKTKERASKALIHYEKALNICKTIDDAVGCNIVKLNIAIAKSVIDESEQMDRNY